MKVWKKAKDKNLKKQGTKLNQLRKEKVVQLIVGMLELIHQGHIKGMLMGKDQ